MPPKPQRPDAGARGGVPGSSRSSSGSSKGDVDNLSKNLSGLAVSQVKGSKTGTATGGTSPKKSRFSISSVTEPSDIARALGAGHFKDVVCLVGAGISTRSGIPDFRSKGTGLYDNLAKYNLSQPEDIFDIEFYREQPLPFVTLAQELYPGAKYRPNTAHYFLRLLHEKRALRRVYTQNIDGLERLAGVPADKLVEAHGTFATASCTACRRAQDPAAVRATILAGKVPRCAHCRRLAKPDIVFFGESLPERFHRLHAADLRACDLLLVLGTSLMVQPFAGLVDGVRAAVPRLLVNRDLVGPFRRIGSAGGGARRPGSAPDLALQGDLVAALQGFCEACDWHWTLAKLESAGERPFLTGAAQGAAGGDAGGGGGGGGGTGGGDKEPLAAAGAAIAATLAAAVAAGAGGDDDGDDSEKPVATADADKPSTCPAAATSASPDVCTPPMAESSGVSDQCAANGDSTAKESSGVTADAGDVAAEESGDAPDVTTSSSPSTDTESSSDAAAPPAQESAPPADSSAPNDAAPS